MHPPPHLPSAVLLANITKHDGQPGEPCVIKIDTALNMLKEYKGTKKMADKLGENACAPIQTCYHDPERETDEYFLDLPKKKKEELKEVESAKLEAEVKLKAARKALEKAESTLKQAEQKREALYEKLVRVTCAIRDLAMPGNVDANSPPLLAVARTCIVCSQHYTHPTLYSSAKFPKDAQGALQIELAGARWLLPHMQGRYAVAILERAMRNFESCSACRLQTLATFVLIVLITADSYTTNNPLTTSKFR